MRIKTSDHYWIIVKVERGVPTMAEIYTEYNDAKKREVMLRKRINEENDEIGVFHSKVKGKPEISYNIP